MEGCFGLLRSGASDSIRLSLAVRDDVLVATDAGGAGWDIPLDRVHLTSWAADELRLELAGAEVSFIPEDPDRALATLVPALLARERRGVAAVPASAPAPPPERPLTVDLTERASRRRPAAPEPPASLAVAPPVGRRYRALGGVILLAAAIAAGVIIAQQRSTVDVSAAARAALAAGGYPPIEVVVEGNRATLTGIVPTGEISNAAAAAVAGVDGIDAVVNELQVAAPPSTTLAGAPATATVSEAAAGALANAGLAAVALRVDDAGLAVLSGTVPSEADRRRAAAALVGLPGITRIDNQLAVALQPDDAVQAAARAALDAGGYQSVQVVVEGGVATVTGVAPREILQTGFFRYADAVNAVVLPVEGVAGLRNRLQIAGDEATLRRQLRDLTTLSPVVFALGRADLSAAAAQTLDAAAEIIQRQPGLRVLIAGHTDTTGSTGFNEELSRERAEAVRGYLIEQGVAANRLLVVAYGELFPTTPGAAPNDRRVEFEVAG